MTSQEAPAVTERAVSINSCVYGAPDGKVAFLDAPEGIIPPPHIGHLVYLGPTYDVVTIAVNLLRAGRADDGRQPSAQRALADLIGAGSQQVVSRWVNAQAAPRLSDDQWAKLVRLVLAV